MIKIRDYKLVWFEHVFGWVMTGIIGPDNRWFLGYSKGDQVASFTDFKEDIQKPSIKVYKETSEDWYPSFKLSTTHISKGLVKVSFHYPVTTHNGYMVSVWGADDCGMELQFSEKQKAMDCFMNIISMKDITISQLKELGLHNA